MNIKQSLSLGLATLLIATSCGTKQYSIRTRVPESDLSSGRIIADPKERLIDDIVRQSEGWSAIRASLRGNIVIGKRDFSSKINLIAIKGEGIRLSVVPFPLIEAARAWFTREGITLVDLIGGRYAQESYEVFSQRLGIQIDYNQIEALFIGQAFAPGLGCSAESLSTLKYTTQGQSQSLAGKLRSVSYLFNFGSEGILSNIEVLDALGRKVFETEYRGAQSSEQTVFPQFVRMILWGGMEARAERGRLELEWNSVSPASATDLSVSPVIKSHYERISIDQVLKLIERI